MDTYQPRSTTELVIYFCQSVESGLEHCSFDDCDIQAAGGILGIEAELAKKTYWFVQLGKIVAQLTPRAGAIRRRLLAFQNRTSERGR